MSIPRNEIVKAKMSLWIFEMENHKDEVIDEMREVHPKLEELKKGYEKKVIEQFYKAEQLNAEAKNSKSGVQVVKKLVKLHNLKKCEEKKERLQKKIKKLEASDFDLEYQILMRQGQAKAAEKACFDKSPKHEKSAIKSEDMTLKDEEVKKMVRKINRDFEYMQLSLLARFGRRCEQTLKKPFLSMKKLPATEGQSPNKAIRS